MTKRVWIISAALLAAVSAAAQAGPSEALAFAIGQCSSQPDDKARLACFDQIAAQLKAGTFGSAQVSQAAPAGQASPPPFVSVPAPSAAPQPSVAPAAQPVAPPAVAKAVPPRDSGTWYDPTSWFGKDNPETKSSNPADFGAENIRQATADESRPKPLDEIRANVTAVSYGPTGHFTVTLANGQVWRQIPGDVGVARFKRKGGDVVTISRGALGSYNLVVEGRKALFKVNRVQ